MFYVTYCRYSEKWFRHEFMQEQTFLNDLPAAEREFVVEVASYAVLKTDMRVRAVQGGMSRSSQHCTISVCWCAWVLRCCTS